MPILPSGDRVWFATKYGLYRYNKVQDEWSVFAAGNGLSGSEIRDIGVDEGIIWVATDNGISNSDLRFSDWRSYTVDDGLPSNDIKAIGFSEDYVWVGTAGGAARFDKILEEWEIYTEADGLAGGQVNDIAIDGDVAWFATSNGVSRFEIEFNKWTNYMSSANVTWSIASAEYVWFVTDSELVRYSKRLKSWKPYTESDGIISYSINNMVMNGADIWLATESGISTYDPVADSWSVGLAYHAMLPGTNIRDIAIDGNLVWFCTHKGVSSYNNDTGSWKHYTVADGLLDSDAGGIIVSGNVFVVTKNGINLYDKKSQEWETYEFPRSGDGNLAKSFGEGGLRIDDRGLGYDFSKTSQLRLSGFSSVEFADTSSLKPDRQDDYEWNTLNDLILTGTIPGERSISGFYNDLKADNIEYGATYRGNEEDILQEATGGEFEAQMRNSELIEDINMLGGGARLRKNLDGVRLNVEPRYGQQRGYFETDFFVYKTGTTIYHLSHQNIIPETDEVWVRKEKLSRSLDYLIVYPNGWLVFHREELVEEGEKIEIRYQYEPIAEENQDKRLALLTTGMDMGDNYYAGIDMLHRDDLDIISLNAEGENIRAGNVSMKLRPEIAYSRQRLDDHTIDGMASRAEFIANIPRTQIKADYELYGDGFSSPGRQETRYGILDSRVDLFSQVDATQWLPVKFKWLQERSTDEGMVKTSENDFKLNLVLSRESYPILALTGERNTVDSFDSDETENSARGDIQYNFPDLLLSAVGIRKADISGYYRESRGSFSEGKKQKRTGYGKLNLHPIERFVLSTSYQLSRADDEAADASDYQLSQELRRLLFRSNFSSIDGIISTLFVDDLSFKTRSAAGDMDEDKDRNLAASLNLLPGAWTEKLDMLTLAGIYSLLHQTVIVTESSGENEIQNRANNKARSLRFQANLRPHNTILWTGTYEKVKNWIQEIPPLRKIIIYRNEIEFKPGAKSRIVMDYYQRDEDEDGFYQASSYSPSLWWETRWSQKWVTRLRGIYEYNRIRENGDVLESGSTLTPGLSFRYTAKKLPHGGRLYLSQGASISVDRSQRDKQELASETYSTSSVLEWSLTRNFSLRLRANLSYQDNRAQGIEDESFANIYVRALAKF